LSASSLPSWHTMLVFLFWSWIKLLSVSPDYHRFDVTWMTRNREMYSTNMCWRRCNVSSIDALPS
jgi:hypothetical protein